METESWGRRDARGEWQPKELPKASPLFSFPWKSKTILVYLFGPVGLLWPWNLGVALLSVLTWLFFTPSLERTQYFGLDWIAEIYLRDLVLVTVVAGGLHLRLYTTRGQGLNIGSFPPIRSTQFSISCTPPSFPRLDIRAFTSLREEARAGF